MWDQVMEMIESNGTIHWVMIIAASVGLAVFAKLLLKFVESRISEWVPLTRGRWDDSFLEVIRGTKTGVLFIWILAPLSRVPAEQGPGLRSLMTNLVVIVTAFQFGIWGLRALRIWKETYLRKRIETDLSSASALNLLSTALKGAFLICLVLIALSNLGVDIGALVAGLGIGGIAVALAAQNILGDLFGSLSIVLDKPFVVGDFIAVGNDMGTVEYVGIKTTRLRSLSGEQLIFSNKDLLESRIKNFKRMNERRVVFNFSVPFDTPLEKLKVIPGWIQEFVSRNEMLRFERSHLAGHGRQGASSLDFETVYWVKDPDYNKFMDLQQDLYHQVLAKITQENLSFALPTHVVQGLEAEVTFGREEDEFDDLETMKFNDTNN